MAKFAGKVFHPDEQRVGEGARLIWEVGGPNFFGGDETSLDTMKIL